MNHSYINIDSFTINNKNQIFNKVNTESKKEKLIKNKSENCLSKQTFIENKEDKLTLTTNIKNRDNTNIIDQISDNIIYPNNKIHIFTYNCTNKEISSLKIIDNFEYLNEIDVISKSLKKPKIF